MAKLPRTIYPLQPRALRERWMAPVTLIDLPRLTALRDELRPGEAADASVRGAADASMSGGDAGAVLDASVWVERDRLGLVHLRMHIAGRVVLTCQRCLQGLDWRIDLDADVLVVEPGRVPERDDLEFIEVDERGALDLFDAIDEELLLALPVIPRHAVCQAPRM